MRAIIPVAGFGTRLRPHTFTLPKVLLNVAGKPILGHILDSLQAQNINQATIIVGYMAELIEEYVTTTYSMDVTFVRQDEPQGLGHAIWCARETFSDEPIFIILGDTIFDVDIAGILQSPYNTLGVKEVKDPRRFGVVELTDGFISKMVEKPENPPSHLAIVGLYYIANSAALKQALCEIVEGDIRTRNEYQLTDALQMMINRGEKFTAFPVDGWYDCGKPETLLDTNRYLLATMDTPISQDGSVIIPPSFVDGSAVLERSIIGPFATIAAGAVISDSHIENSIVSNGATVRKSLLNESIIGNNSVVNGSFRKLNVGDSSEVNDTD